MKKRLRAVLIFALAAALILGLAAGAQAAAAKRITLNRRAISMDWGTGYPLIATVTPTNASDRNQIEWVSGDPALVTVIQDPLNPRKATVMVRPNLDSSPYPILPVIVTATTAGGRSASCLVTVKKVDVAFVSVSPAAKALYLTTPRPTYTLPVPVMAPSVAGDQSYEWVSGDDTIATVKKDVDGKGVVTFWKEGTVRIYAEHKNDVSTVRDFCTFVIKPIRVKSIALNKSQLYVGIGEEFTLESTVLPVNASYTGVEWKCNNDVVEVVKDGDEYKFKPLKSGIATLTATTDTTRYAKNAYCTVYVRDAVPKRVTITAAGDCVLGGDPRTTGITARSTQREFENLIALNGAEYPFYEVRKLFAENGGSGHPNLGIVNVEVSLTTRGGRNPSTSRKYLFRGNPRNAAALAVGIDVANIANNHTSDFGSSSFRDTAGSINTYGGGAVPSGFSKYNTSYTYQKKEVGDKTVGFFGAQVNQLPYSLLVSRIQKAKVGCDMLVVTFHWTGLKENTRSVNSTMRSYARKAIDAGADVVIGHHRHVFSGIEKYKGKYIVYDLGNFVTGGGSSPFTYAVQIDFDISSDFTETAVNSGKDAIRIYPIYTMSVPSSQWDPKTRRFVRNDNNWQPVPVENAIASKDAEGKETLVENGLDTVAALISAYSPVNIEGTKFNAAEYMVPYSTFG